MDPGFEPQCHHHHPPLQLLKWNSFNVSLGLGKENVTAPNLIENLPCIPSTNGVMPVHPDEQPCKPKQPYEACDLFCQLPRSSPGFAPLLNPLPGEKISSVNDNCKGTRAKKFLVFDQSGGQTTLIFSSELGPLAQFQPSRRPKFGDDFESENIDLGVKKDEMRSSLPSLSDGCNEENENDIKNGESEMHEDTDELNALLYSDDEFEYSDEEDEASTGNSPDTLTCCQNLDSTVEGEVASSVGRVKRQKLVSGGGCRVSPSLTIDGAQLLKKDGNRLDYEEDATSVVNDGKGSATYELGSLCRKKRSRKDEIREAIRVLQDLIPGREKGRDAFVVLEEAIRYLRFLKEEAKSLGIDSF